MGGWTRRVMATTLVLAAATATACSESTTAPRSASGLLQVQEVLSFRNAMSGYTEPTRIVVADPAAWAAEWARIHAHVQPVPPLPEIDFAGSVVVIAGMGPRHSGGFQVTIEQVRAQSGALFVDVVERSPGSACITTAAVTSPVHAVQVPRQGTTASFTIRRETYSC